MNDSTAPQLHPRRNLARLGKYWWVLFVTLLLGLGVATALVLAQPPAYISTASMCETEMVRLPESAQFTQAAPDLAPPHTALLQSRAMRDLTIARLKSATPNVVIPLGKDGEPLPVALQVPEAPGSSMVRIVATSSDEAYIQAYLDALMNTYLEYTRNVRKVISGGTLASISEQVQRAERDLRAEQELLRAFQQTNDPAISRAQEAVAVECLKRLNTQLSDLQLEDSLARRPSAPQSDALAIETIQFKMDHIQKSIQEWESKLAGSTNLLFETQRLEENVRRSQSVYERLVQLLQNVGLNRNLNRENLVILEAASPARRSYTREQVTFVSAGAGGLGLGIGLVGLLGIYRRPNQAN